MVGWEAHLNILARFSLCLWIRRNRCNGSFIISVSLTKKMYIWNREGELERDLDETQGTEN